MERTYRIVVAKPGLDGHDRGAKVVARALRDAGNEVIYTGLHQTPEQIVETALAEDADAIGVSVLSGAHMTLFRRILGLLEERDASDIVVFGGGIIPEDDIPQLREIGVATIFTPGATTTDISDLDPSGGSYRGHKTKVIGLKRDLEREGLARLFEKVLHAGVVALSHLQSRNQEPNRPKQYRVEKDFPVPPKVSVLGGLSEARFN